MLSKFLMLDRRRGSARRECGAAAAAAVLDESNSMPRTFSSYWCNFCVIRHCSTYSLCPVKNCKCNYFSCEKHRSSGHFLQVQFFQCRYVVQTCYWLNKTWKYLNRKYTMYCEVYIYKLPPDIDMHIIHILFNSI